MVVFVGECSMVCAHLRFIVHTALSDSNRWSGIQGGTVGWKMGCNDGCSYYLSRALTSSQRPYEQVQYIIVRCSELEVTGD